MLIPLLGILCVSVGSRWGATLRRGRNAVCRNDLPVAIVRRHARRWQWYLRHDPIASSPSRRFAVSVVNVTLSVAVFVSLTPIPAQALGICTPVFWYYHGDHPGSTSVITDRNGALVWHYERFWTCSFPPQPA